MLSKLLLQSHHGRVALGTTNKWLGGCPLKDGGRPPPICAAVTAIRLREVPARQSEAVVLPGPTEEGGDVFANPSRACLRGVGVGHFLSDDKLSADVVEREALEP